MAIQFWHPYVGTVDVEVTERTSPGVLILTVSEPGSRLMEHGLTLSRLDVDECRKPMPGSRGCSGLSTADPDS